MRGSREIRQRGFRWRADNGPNFECWLGSFVIFQGIRTSIDT